MKIDIKEFLLSCAPVIPLFNIVHVRPHKTLEATWIVKIRLNEADAAKSPFPSDVNFELERITEDYELYATWFDGIRNVLLDMPFDVEEKVTYAEACEVANEINSFLYNAGWMSITEAEEEVIRCMARVAVPLPLNDDTESALELMRELISLSIYRVLVDSGTYTERFSKTLAVVRDPNKKNSQTLNA